MSEAELDRCLERLRYAVAGEYVRVDDINVRVECTRLLRDVLAGRVPGDPLIDELDAIIAKLRYVKAGDIIEPEDHNYIVDSLRKARDVIVRIEEQLRARIEELEYMLVFAQPAYGFRLGVATSPLRRFPDFLRLVAAPSLVLLTELDVYVGYVSPATELLVEVKSGA